MVCRTQPGLSKSRTNIARELYSVLRVTRVVQRKKSTSCKMKERLRGCAAAVVSEHGFMTLWHTHRFKKARGQLRLVVVPC